MKVQESIMRPAMTKETIFGGIVTESLRKEIAASDEKRKFEKMTLMKEARQKWTMDLLEMSRNLKKSTEDLQHSKTLSKIDKDILSKRLKKLKKRCSALEYEVNALHGHGQGQMSQHGP